MKIGIIGGGIGGLATAILLAKDGHKVTIHEKNPNLGGKADVLKVDGFTFDMGPSWYLMPDVFERFFELIGENQSNHYELVKLPTAYKVFYDYREPLTVGSSLNSVSKLFEKVEPGAGDKLRDYVAGAEDVYNISMDEFLYRDSLRYKDILSVGSIRYAHKMLPLISQSLDTYVSRRFKSLALRQILEYHMVFLGASPFNAPALYHLMSYIDIKQGVYYPKGGLRVVIDALEGIARKHGVSIKTNQNVQKITVRSAQATGIKVNSKNISYDFVVSNADLHHTETKLLTSIHRSYSKNYWSKTTQGPSALLMYLGIKGKLPELNHHNFVFVKDWQQNFDDIFKNKVWPDNPSVYVCKSTQTDNTVAPKGHENVFVLVPLPATLDKQVNIEEYADRILKHIETHTKTKLADKIVYKKLFGPQDFAEKFNAYAGSALGLAHTLRQSAFFRPDVESKKVDGLYYVGANVQPGIGLPMCLISAEHVRNRIAQEV